MCLATLSLPQDKILFPLDCRLCRKNIFYPADFASLTNSLSLTQTRFLGILTRQACTSTSTHASKAVPCSKLNESRVQEKIYSKKKICFKFTKCFKFKKKMRLVQSKTRDHIGGSNSNRSWSLVIVPVGVSRAPKSDFSYSVWREQLTVH